uniref:Uncharacterized protein n=1 Tax=Glossina palpalis gambiensis TaxID=67801 RepID=A0A1B0AUV2_9MUSC
MHTTVIAQPSSFMLFLKTKANEFYQKYDDIVKLVPYTSEGCGSATSAWLHRVFYIVGILLINFLDPHLSRSNIRLSSCPS